MDLAKLFFGSQNNTPDETNGVNNIANCYKEAVQFNVFLIVTSLFASFFYEICGTAMKFVLFSSGQLSANTPLDRSSALVLLQNYKLHQIRN